MGKENTGKIEILGVRKLIFENNGEAVESSI